MGGMWRGQPNPVREIGQKGGCFASQNFEELNRLILKQVTSSEVKKEFQFIFSLEYIPMGNSDWNNPDFYPSIPSWYLRFLTIWLQDACHRLVLLGLVRDSGR